MVRSGRSRHSSSAYTVADAASGPHRETRNHSTEIVRNDSANTQGFSMGKLMMKICSKCGDSKNLRSFKKDVRYRDGIFCWCKECERKYAASPAVCKRRRERWAKAMKNPRYRAAQRRRSRERWQSAEGRRKLKTQVYKRQYGISLEKFERAKWCADHNHETGIHRGPLCYRCNLAISQAEKHPKWLRRVKQYLRRK